MEIKQRSGTADWKVYVRSGCMLCVAEGCAVPPNDFQPGR